MKVEDGLPNRNQGGRWSLMTEHTVDSLECKGKSNVEEATWSEESI